jgi:hypothetical protein
MLITGLHLMQNAWSLTVSQMFHYRKTYVLYSTLCVLCPVGLHFVTGLPNKALAHENRIKDTMYSTQFNKRYHLRGDLFIQDKKH